MLESSEIEADCDVVPLRWNWLWFVPVCVVVLSLVEVHTTSLAWQLLKLAYKRWTWGVFLSPSAYFCACVLVASVSWPLLGLLRVSVELKLRQRNRYLRVLGMVIFILVLPAITDALLWGSFPFTFGHDGVARLRMIPFIPWPTGKFLEF